jgi:hypothetical protein
MVIGQGGGGTALGVAVNTPPTPGFLSSLKNGAVHRHRVAVTAVVPISSSSALC